MKLYLKQKGIMFFAFLFYYLLIEFVAFRWLDFSFLPESFLIDLLYILMIGLIPLLIRSHKISIVYYTLILAWVMTLFLINATTYSVYFDLFTLQQLTLVAEATNVFNFEFLAIPAIIIAAVIGISYFVTIILLYRKIYKSVPTDKAFYQRALPVSVISAIVIALVWLLPLTSIKHFKNSDYIMTFRRASLEEYGLLAYYGKETKIIFSSMFIRNDADDVADMIEYDPSLPSDYNGLLEDANVITILVESLQPFAVNEVLTPNLDKLVNEGLNFTNSYSENKTNVSEMIAMTGNYPAITFLPNTFAYDFSNSLPNVLSETYGYRTGYFHDNVSSFYARNRLIPALGFTEGYYHDDLFPGEKLWNWNGDYTLDSITIEKILDKMELGEEPFYYYWATMVSHGPYNYGPGNKELFTEAGYFQAIDEAETAGLWVNPLEGKAEIDQQRIRHYQAAIMDFDKALGILLEALEEKNLLEETILVLFGDHNVYYHELAVKMNDVDKTMYYDMDLYSSFLNIYNPLLTGKYFEDNGTNAIEKFVSPYNIVPTLFDLLGLSYNQNLMLAESVFNDVDEVFYSHKLTGFFDDQVFSDDGYEINFRNNSISDVYLQEFFITTEKLRKRQETINYWYDLTKQPLR